MLKYELGIDQRNFSRALLEDNKPLVLHICTAFCLKSVIKVLLWKNRGMIGTFSRYKMTYKLNNLS